MNSGKTPVLPPAFDIKQLGGFSAVDLELIRILEWTVDDVARVFGLPRWLLSRDSIPKKLGESGEVFDRWSLRGHRRNLEDEMTVKLLSPSDRAKGIAVRIDTSHYSLGSLADLAAIADLLVRQTVLISPNEGRALINYKPDPDPQADKRLPLQGAPPEMKAMVKEILVSWGYHHLEDKVDEGK